MLRIKPYFQFADIIIWVAQVEEGNLGGIFREREG